MNTTAFPFQSLFWTGLFRLYTIGSVGASRRLCCSRAKNTDVFGPHANTRVSKLLKNWRYRLAISHYISLLTNKMCYCLMFKKYKCLQNSFLSSERPFWSWSTIHTIIHNDIGARWRCKVRTHRLIQQRVDKSPRFKKYLTGARYKYIPPSDNAWKEG